MALIDPDAPPKPAAIGDVVVAGPLLGGSDNRLEVPVTSLDPNPVEVTVTPELAAGWTGAAVTVTVPSGETVRVPIDIRPSLTPQDATVTLRATSPSGPVANGVVELAVISVPNADATAFAFDAGAVGSPVLAGYTALTPSSRWSESAGFGWVSGTVLDRDRNRIDVLRRDIVLSREQSVLRLRVPPGQSRAWLLTGDAFAPGARTTVAIDGAVVADSGPAPIPQGAFRWIDWPMSGGPDGADVDLTLTGSEGDRYWRVACLVVLPE